MARERRLVFGETAESYDRYRPTYPPALIDDLVVMAGLDGQRAVLEAGAGTGKATVLFAARGIPVVAVEPSPEMAAVARRACAEYPHVEVHESDFEAWDPQGQTFPLLYSGQAWHWVPPEAGLARAREALDRGGLMAVFWNRPVWTRAELREPLMAVYERMPELEGDSPMHPANLLPDAGIDWRGQIACAPGLGDAEIRYYDWSRRYTAEEYTGLLGTTSEFSLMPEERRAPVLGAIGAVIEAHGGAMELPMTTRVCLARREG